MNQKTAKLIRKSITASTGLTGKQLRHAIKTTKKEYNQTPRNNRRAIKIVLSQEKDY